MDQDARPRSLMRRHLKPLLFVAALLALAAGVAVFPIGEWLLRGIEWIETQGPIAWAVFVLAYIAAAVLLVPGTIPTLAAGFVFGLPLGVALVSAGSVLGAATAFLVGRFFARDWIRGRIANLPRFAALDRAVSHDGFVIVLLTRLSPLFPFNLLNYALGITGVRFRDYFFASWIGMLPATVLYVYIGTLAGSVTELATSELGDGWATRSLLAGGFVATLILTVLITRKATLALRAHLGQEEAVAGEPHG